MTIKTTNNLGHQVTIETERLVLRPFTMDDLDEFALICADPQVMRFIGDGKPVSKEIVKDRMQSWINEFEECGYGLMALILKENNKLLGFCGFLHQIVDEESYIELGYRLETAFWGRGIATEAAMAVRDYALNQLKFTSLISIIHVDNEASKKVAQKIGMRLMKKTTFKGNLVDIFCLNAAI